MAIAGFAVSMVCLLLLLRCHATDYIVGGDDHWTSDVSMESWPHGKHFYAGDNLIFIYDADEGYNVVMVNKKGHDECAEVGVIRKSESGHDTIALNFGANYFICSANDACSQGMKIAINATARPPHPPAI